MMHTTAFYQKRIGFIIAELFGLQFLAIFFYLVVATTWTEYFLFIFLAFVQPFYVSFTYV